MYAMRRWSVRHARGLEWLYDTFAAFMLMLDPLWRRIGYERLEGPAATVEKAVKGFLFDCRMCGHCVLSHTGMSCPMNCPKALRNGPCGGVRPDGMCEIEPEMRCVWIEAYEGSLRMRNPGNIETINGHIDETFKNRSSWLRVTHEAAEARRGLREASAADLVRGRN
ncbi:MAG: hypothetical protein FJY54_04610 [Betaproteobacteria bacterium]|nr:hypothetical protein [Betaproteobacteria bacterium]